MAANPKEILLTQMYAGQKGTVNRILGGFGLRRRLENMGIRPGKEITKISEIFLSGPVIIKLQGSKIALGRGMAKKIFINIA